jgi:hypothetical protein
LLHILSLQKAGGGFEIDSTLAQAMKIPLGDLHKQAARIQVESKKDKFRLLSRAIVLKYLEDNYADKKASWQPCG